MKRKFKRSAKKTGKYKSRLESSIAKILGRKARYEVDRISYSIPRAYVPDFKVGGWYLEVKGYFRAEDRVKMAAVKRCNPELDIRFYFPQDNRLSSKHQMRYSDWCDKHGFPFAIGSIPKDWIA